MGAALPPPEFAAALRRMGLLAGASPEALPSVLRGEALTGGVSSDIWRIDLEGGSICVKRALAQLRVAAEWRAPVARNGYEAAWMRVAARAAPGSVPRLLGQDEAAGVLAMEYLPPARYGLWKSALREGRADPAFAALVAGMLVRIHAASAAEPGTAAEFPTDAIFHDIRLSPYLLAASLRHPDRAAALHGLVDATMANKRALVHGDVSPKNILVGPEGPVLLDAECAWWGDPAFDLAFCLNHLLLKCLWVPGSAPALLACFDAMVAAYLPGVDWEAADALETRAARLLPGLLLARVDGKSPVEYITAEAGRDRVRGVARALLAAPAERLLDVRRAWTLDVDAVR